MKSLYFEYFCVFLRFTPLLPFIKTAWLIKKVPSKSTTFVHYDSRKGSIFENWKSNFRRNLVQSLKKKYKRHCKTDIFLSVLRI